MLAGTSMRKASSELAAPAALPGAVPGSAEKTWPSASESPSTSRSSLPRFKPEIRSSLRAPRIVVGLHLPKARVGANVKHPDIGSATGTDTVIVQTGGNIRADGHLRLRHEIAGGDHGAVNIFPGKGDLGEIVQVAAKKG